MHKNSIEANLNILRRNLLSWFQQNKRDLPWRNTKNVYHIWLSEIILQQTRVNQGMPYFLKFTEAFKDIFALAEADEQQVMRLWQGLGYYSRARNMHAAAKQVVNDFKGEFPQEYNEILKLKGVGEYTAAAIASIAFNKPEAVLDGNVYRVLSRLFADFTPVNAPEAKKHFRQIAQNVLDKEQSGDFNQAMMELGATVCIPQNPLCSICPVHRFCNAFELGIMNELPKKLPKRAVKNRYLHYLLIYKGKKIYLKRRPAGDIWQGLYDLPLIETGKEGLINPNEISNSHIWHVQKMLHVYTLKHQLTHQTLYINFYLAEADVKSSDFILTDLTEIKKYPLPRPVDLFFQHYFKSMNLF